jgi:hypothetical protein
MGAQIGVDFAMAGLDVVCMVRAPEVGQRRLTEASDLLKSFTSVEEVLPRRSDDPNPDVQPGTVQRNDGGPRTGISPRRFLGQG